jgi:hypothetical protein
VLFGLVRVVLGPRRDEVEQAAPGVVVFGASMTGGLQSAGCGGTIDSGAASDAAADSKPGYGRISIDAAYGNISVDSGGHYGRIMPAPLAAGDASAPDGGNPTDADTSDANEAG